MVLLSGTHLLGMIKSNTLYIEPFDENSVYDAYVELKLGNKFTALMSKSKGFLDPLDRKTPLKQREMLETEPPIVSQQKYDMVTVEDGERFIVDSHEYILGTTKEFISMPENYIGMLHGKSSLGRLGIQVFCSGGYVDPKFKGHLILEIFNANNVPVALHPGIPIVKLSVQPLSKTATKEPEKVEEEEGETLDKWSDEKKV